VEEILHCKQITTNDMCDFSSIYVKRQTF